MLDVLSFWVKEFDIDGFRFDASWGPSSRYPAFYREVSAYLRKIKPHIILMAEDMTGYPVHYEGSGHPHLKNSGFNWAYDWNNRDPHWISKWSFQSSEEQGETVFNEVNAVKAAEMFVKSVTYTQNDSGISPVRYIENNDTPGFLKNHSVRESRFAASLMFLLPGVPMIFYGQETGNKHELFELPSFDPGFKMSSHDPELWKFYKNLVRTRTGSKALSQGKLSDLKNYGSIVSFKRSHAKEIMLIEADFAEKTVRLNGVLLP